MARPFKTIFDELAELFEKEGHPKRYSATFNSSDKIDFGIPSLNESYKKSDAVMKQLNQIPIGKKNPEDPTPAPDKEQSKQLKLPPSSTIQSAAYWPTKEYLLVSFKSGHTYSYSDVPALTIEFWQAASSAGSWFYYNIRMSYKYQKMG